MKSWIQLICSIAAQCLITYTTNLVPCQVKVQFIYKIQLVKFVSNLCYRYSMSCHRFPIKKKIVAAAVRNNADDAGLSAMPELCAEPVGGPYTASHELKASMVP